MGGAQDDENTVSIKMAIECCLAIKDTHFMFGEIYEKFAEYGLEQAFVQHLEPFIKHGRFRTEAMPSPVLDRLFAIYKNAQKFKELEKIIQQLDLSRYNNKESLELDCQEHGLVSALLYLNTSGKKESSRSALGCI